MTARGSGGRSSTPKCIEERTDALWHARAIEACRVAARAGASAHRGGGRSAGVVRRSGRTPAASSPPGIGADGSRLCAGRRDARNARRRRAGRSARSALYHALRGRPHRGGGEPGRRDGGGGDPPGRSGRAGRDGARHRAANGCAPSRSRRSTSRAGSSMSARFPALEDEMCDFAPGGLSGGARPTGSTRWSGR